MKLFSNRILYFLIFGVSILCSCINTKRITYFQKGVNGSDTISSVQAYIPKIHSGDILSIYVNSLSPEASSFFNPYSANTVTSAQSPDANGGLTQASAPGFLVDASGKIELPLIGSISVTGLTINDATQQIKKQLQTYLKEPTVIVRFLNYKISILGEVAKPGIYVIPNERITLPEAITLAGDVTADADKSQVQIIRDFDNKKQFGNVNLTNREVFSSQYYYLHSNDVVYVKPAKVKATQSNIIFKIVPLAVSVITIVILLASKL